MGLGARGPASPRRRWHVRRPRPPRPPPEGQAAAPRALADNERGLGAINLAIDVPGMSALMEGAQGDARAILTALEIAADHTVAQSRAVIGVESIKEALQDRRPYYDKGADFHYDTISAFIKSVRGSDPDAAVYWLARMIEAGEDPLFIVRRMVILAAEDIGLADPAALTLATSCQQAVHFIGLPEGFLPMAECALYLALAPKSNSALTAYTAALEDAKRTSHLPVPMHLRNATTPHATTPHVIDVASTPLPVDQQILSATMTAQAIMQEFNMPTQIVQNPLGTPEVRRRRDATAIVRVSHSCRSSHVVSLQLRESVRHGLSFTFGEPLMTASPPSAVISIPALAVMVIFPSRIVIDAPPTVSSMCSALSHSDFASWKESPLARVARLSVERAMSAFPSKRICSALSSYEPPTVIVSLPSTLLVALPPTPPTECRPTTSR